MTEVNHSRSLSTFTVSGRCSPAMTAAPRIIRFALGGLSLSLTAIIAVEILSPVSDVAALPRPVAESRQLPGDLMGPPFDADKLIAEILDRPLFTPGRHPPEAQADAASEEEEKKPPELQSRLAGVMIRPDESEALFARDGEKPVAVGEGDEIDGWTVDTIEADRVVLTSDFGEKILQPTPEERTTAIPAAPPARNKKPAPASSVKPGTPAATACRSGQDAGPCHGGAFAQKSRQRRGIDAGPDTASSQSAAGPQCPDQRDPLVTNGRPDRSKRSATMGFITRRWARAILLLSTIIIGLSLAACSGLHSASKKSQQASAPPVDGRTMPARNRRTGPRQWPDRSGAGGELRPAGHATGPD